MANVIPTNKIPRWVNKVRDLNTQSVLRRLFGKFSFAGALDEEVMVAEGTTVPAAGGAGYAPGCVFVKTDAVLGQAITWVNCGTKLSCAFYPFGPVIGWGFMYAGITDSTNGSTTSQILPNLIEYNDICLCTYYASNDNDQVQMSTTAGKSYALVTNSADPANDHDYEWAILREGCTPLWDVAFAGSYDAVAGDTTTVAITVTGVQVGDVCFATYTDSNDDDYVQACVASANTITLTVSADPVTDHTWDYVALRPRGTFRPSHYVAYAGNHTTTADAGGDNTITITGALATDVVMCFWKVSNDGDFISECALTANTLTVNMSADPSTVHALSYAILRAY